MANFSKRSMWIGHASITFKSQKYDNTHGPTVFRSRFSIPIFWVRVTPSQIKIDDIPDIDVVISHNHYDHLDEASIKRLAFTQPNIEFLTRLVSNPCSRNGAPKCYRVGLVGAGNHDGENSADTCAALVKTHIFDRNEPVGRLDAAVE